MVRVVLEQATKLYAGGVIGAKDTSSERILQRGKFL